MVRNSEVRAGWLDATVESIVLQPQTPIERYPWVLITSLDSATDLNTIPAAREAVERYPGALMSAGGLVMHTRDLQDAASRERFLVGFDEIWLFASEPIGTKPPSVSIVGPVDFRGSQPSAGLMTWITDSGCRLGLGDGIGLNYVTMDKDVAEWLETPGVAGKAGPEAS